MKYADGEKYNAVYVLRPDNTQTYKLFTLKMKDIKAKAGYKNEIAIIILIMAHITLETRDDFDKTVERRKARRNNLHICIKL